MNKKFILITIINKFKCISLKFDIKSNKKMN